MSSSFYPFGDTFDGVSISVTLCLKSKPSSLIYSSEVFRAIYEQCGDFDIVFLPQFFEKDSGESGCRGRKQPRVANLVCPWIRNGVQSELLVVDSSHGLVNSDVIR